MWWYVLNNQMEEAKALYKQAEAKKLDVGPVREARFAAAYAEGDAAEMERQIAWAAGKPDETIFTLDRAMIAAQRGRMKEARELYQKAFDMAKESDRGAAAALTALFRAASEYFMGDPAAAKTWASQALGLFHNESVWPATYLAFNGDIPQAQKIIDEQAKARPEATILKLYEIPLVQTAIAIKSGKPAAGIEVLKPALQYNNVYMGLSFFRGLAYYSMKAGKEAAEEFTKAKALRTTGVFDPGISVNQLYLARALAMAGDTAGARREYQDLLAFWKDADPDMPLLVQAKAEYGNLQ